MKKLNIFITILLLCFVVSAFDCNIANAKKPSKEEQQKQLYLKEMNESQAQEGFDYTKAFNDLKPVNVEFIHDEDPDEYYDTQKIHFSPYPLIRLTQTLYFLDKKIEPGFYLMTPREYNDQKCVLFKQGGKIKYVVPIFAHRVVVPELEYRKPPKKWWQIRDRYTFQTQYYERKIRAFDVYNEYYEIDLYYKAGLSKMIFKKHPY
ncbi:MAG: hypothetical protein MJ180_04500 [Candidatus Gastranaerophilales bacterium]|nr:hypothetical protein [Candidatus Gastranaerophilales bacterium]